jgi:hypothetical protein
MKRKKRGSPKVKGKKDAAEVLGAPVRVVGIEWAELCCGYRRSARVGWIKCKLAAQPNRTSSDARIHDGCEE